jgi:prevent-host-death family protein
MMYDPTMTTEPGGDAGGGMTELTATEAKNRFGTVLQHVREGNVVYITHNAHRVAALVPADAAEHLERLEDEYWARRAVDVLASTDRGDWLPMEQVFAALELADRPPST